MGGGPTLWCCTTGGVRMDPFRGCIAVCVCGTIIVSVERRSSFCVFLFECLRARLCGGLVYTVPPKANNKKKTSDVARLDFLTFFQILTFYPPPNPVRSLSEYTHHKHDASTLTKETEVGSRSSRSKDGGRRQGGVCLRFGAATTSHCVVLARSSQVVLGTGSCGCFRPPSPSPSSRV